MAIGWNAGSFIANGTTANTSGSNSVFIGAETKALANGQTNQIVIGYNTTGKGSNTTTIGNTSTTDTYLAGVLTVDSIPDDASPDSVVTTKNGKLYRALMSSGYDSTDNPWKYSSGSTIQRGGGFVGVNTTNPLSRFHTVGAVRSDTSLTPLVLGGTAVSSSLTLQSTSAAGSSDFIAFKTGSGSERVRVTNDGKVGIGTTAPTQALSVAGATTISGQLYMTGSSSSNTIQVNNIKPYSSTANLNLNVNSSAYNVIINEAGGKVGIGTTAPAAKLHVAGAARITDTVYNPIHVGGTDVSSSLTLQSTSGAGSSDFIAFKTGSGTEAARFTTGGRLGIGTTNPAIQLTQKSTATEESAPLSAELLTSSGWTSTDWTGDFATGWTHTTGNTTALLNSLAAINATKYQITWTITNRTAGTITITFGGWSSGAVSATSNTGPITLSTASVVITPTTDFDGKVVLSIKRITGTYNATYAIVDNTGANTFEIRSSLASLNNQFIGVGSGSSNTTGSYNTANGRYSLYSNTTGSSNTANGHYSLYYNTTGIGNTANGMQSLYYNTTGSYNTANGRYSLYSNTTGSSNTANGHYSLYYNTTGSSNTANGMQSLYYNTTGSSNTANGRYSLYSNTTGSSNTANGYEAGRYITGGATANETGANSVFIGASTKANANGETNQIVIGYNATGSGSNSVTLGNTDITKTVLRGNIGIGTTAPAAKLHVNGGIMLDGTDTTGVGSSAKVGAMQYYNGHFYGLISGSPPQWKQLD